MSTAESRFSDVPAVYLDDVEALLEDVLAPDARPAPALGKNLYAAARHTALAPAAKHTRPRLVYWFGSAIGAPTGRLAHLAVTGELIHAASLVHDDVIDAGTVRRGRPTVNRVWDNVTAVLTGDLMFSLAFGLLREDPMPVMSSAVTLLHTMSSAAIEEVHACGDLDLPLERWREIAAGKTGALFGWCGSAPARLIGDEDAAQRFEQCGAHLGVAFQLADDLKDLLVDDGKDRFADIKNRNPSFPILWAAARAPKVAEALRAAWTEPTLTVDDVAHLGDLVFRSGAVEEAASTLRQEIAAGLDALGDLRDDAAIGALESWAYTLLAAAQLSREAA